jgi:hypothetical protein
LKKTEAMSPYGIGYSDLTPRKFILEKEKEKEE